MKKLLILITILGLFTGCTNINKADIDDLISEVQKSDSKLANQYRTGYKYYLAANLNIKETDNFNEIILYKDYKYYMYVDIVSYYEKIDFTYEENNTSYISKNITYKNKLGYLEVNVKNDKYLIEIMYNYAKIEVIVDEEDLNEAIVNSLLILSTIKYNNDIIGKMMGDDALNFAEEQLNIFKTNKGESNFLEYVEEYDTYDGVDVPDLDKITRGA